MLKNLTRPLLTALLICGLSVPAMAQQQQQQQQAQQPQKQQASKTSLKFAQSIANNCLDQAWGSQSCKKAVSDSNKVLAANYIAALKQQGKTQAAETIKQECAASTALRQMIESGEEVPQAAAADAYTVCINQMYDTIQATKVQPDMSHYQLLLIPTLCTREDPRCQQAAASLQPLKTQG